MRAPELGAIAIKAAVERAGIDPKAVQEVSHYVEMLTTHLK